MSSESTESPKSLELPPCSQCETAKKNATMHQQITANITSKCVTLQHEADKKDHEIAVLSDKLKTADEHIKKMHWRMEESRTASLNKDKDILRLITNLEFANTKSERLEAENNNLRLQNNKLVTEVSEAQKAIAELTANLESQKKAAEAIKQDFFSLEGELTEAMTQLEQELTTAQAAVNYYEGELRASKDEVTFCLAKLEEKDDKIAKMKVQLNGTRTDLAQFGNANRALDMFVTEMAKLFMTIGFEVIQKNDHLDFRIVNFALKAREQSVQYVVDTWTNPRIEIGERRIEELPLAIESVSETRIEELPPDIESVSETRIEETEYLTVIDTKVENSLEIDTKVENSVEIDTKIEDSPTSLFASFAKWALVVSVLVFCCSIALLLSGTSSKGTSSGGTSSNGTSSNTTLPEDPDSSEVSEDWVRNAFDKFWIWYLDNI